MPNQLHTFCQDSPYASPWTFAAKVKMLVWEIVWALLCSWTPKPFNKWRIFWLQMFGAIIDGHPFVHQRAKIQIPWNLTLHNHACLGDGAIAYSLGEIEIFEDATIAQEAYLCTGTHDFTDPNRPLQVGKITVHKSSFIGTRAFVMPGIVIGEYSVIGACSVVTHDVQDRCTVAGNPARFIKHKPEEVRC